MPKNEWIEELAAQLEGHHDAELDIYDMVDDQSFSIEEVRYDGNANTIVIALDKK